MTLPKPEIVPCANTAPVPPVPGEAVDMPPPPQPLRPQAGNSTYAAAATVTRSVVVTNPTAVVSATNGKALYASNGCRGCHGTPPSSMNVLNGANNPTLLRSAINSIGAMGSYASLTDAQLADIAAYLATPNI